LLEQSRCYSEAATQFVQQKGREKEASRATEVILSADMSVRKVDPYGEIISLGYEVMPPYDAGNIETQMRGRD